MLTKTSTQALSTLIGFAALLSSPSSAAEDMSLGDWFDPSRLKINASTEYLIQGDFSASYDVLAGGEVQYTLYETDHWQHFIKAGYRQALASDNSSLSLFDVGFGSSYGLTQIYGKTVSVDYTLGAVYSSEEFSTQLIDKEIKKTFTATDFQASVGLSLELSDHFHSRLFVSQMGNKATSAGLNLSYEF